MIMLYNNGKSISFYTLFIRKLDYFDKKIVIDDSYLSFCNKFAQGYRMLLQYKKNNNENANSLHDQPIRV